MSYKRGWKALNLEMTDRIPHTEYCSNPDLVKVVTGIDYERDAKAWKLFYKKTDYDFLWNWNDGGPRWDMEVKTCMGHAVFGKNGKDYNNKIYCPFKTIDDVLSFSPIEKFGIPDVEELVNIFEKDYMEGQAKYDGLVFPGGRNKTLFSACINVFGWEMFLLSAPADPKRFEKILDEFMEISLAQFTAWSKTSAKVIISHDDITWTSGPVFHPEWYRKYIFPRYKKMWSVLKEKGKILIFCSDGNCTHFIDDVVNAGADGFIFEPCTDLEVIIRKYGQNKIVIGNIDCRILMSGTKEDIRSEVKRCADLGKNCPGYFFAVGNHIPYNIPVDNALYYFDCIKELGAR